MKWFFARKRSRGNAHIPQLEALEGRALLTSSSSYTRVATVQSDYNSYVGYLETLERHSKVTKAQYLALRDDVLAITQAASTTKLPLQTANLKAAAASLQIDRAFLLGWLDNAGWAEVKSRFAGNLSGLNVPQDVIDKTIADMQAVAESAGVSIGAYNTFNKKAETLRHAQENITASYTNFDDPQLYYTRHLRGFVHGGVSAKRRDSSALDADIREFGSAGGRASVAILKRDVKYLEKIEASLSTDARTDVGDAIIKVFSSSPPDLGKLAASLNAAVGKARTRTTANAISKFVADSPRFFAALGSSIDNLTTIVDDVGDYVSSGGGVPENAFRVQILRTGGKS